MSKHEMRHGRRTRRAADTSDAEARGAGYRHARLTQILREELTALMRDELDDPRLDGVTITGVELSVDYRTARIRFIGPRRAQHTRDERDHLERALARATPFLRGRLAESVELKQAPAIRFTWDQDAAERPEGWSPEGEP
jgi:ribosome-binding factor A